MTWPLVPWKWLDEFYLNFGHLWREWTQMMFYWLKHPEHDGRRLWPTRHIWQSMCIVFAVMSSAHFLHSLYSYRNPDHQEFNLGSLLVHVLSYITWCEISFRESDFLLSLEILFIVYCYMNSPTAPNSLLFPLLVFIPVTQFTFIVGTKIYLSFRWLIYFFVVLDQWVLNSP
jgi:hypothetical protein